MAFNIDGFNERTTFIRNSNNMRRLRKNGSSKFDNSFAKMRVEERNNLVQTTNRDRIEKFEQARGNKENFILRNKNISNANNNSNDNRISDIINRNILGK